MANSDSSSMIHLNVGGKEFCTTVGTLTGREPDSMLAAMFSGRHSLCPDAEKGYVFIDRDGEQFRHILNWLRNGTVVGTLQASEYSELLIEAEYYQLLGLMNELGALLQIKREGNEDEDVCSELTRTDIIKYFIPRRKWEGGATRFWFRGVNLCSLDLSGLDLSEIDFSYACIRNVRFSGADLTGAKFNYANAESAIFDSAILCRAGQTMS